MKRDYICSKKCRMKVVDYDLKKGDCVETVKDYEQYGSYTRGCIVEVEDDVITLRVCNRCDIDYKKINIVWLRKI